MRMQQCRPIKCLIQFFGLTFMILQEFVFVLVHLATAYNFSGFWNLEDDSKASVRWCWNDTHANMSHPPACEMNSVEPICCLHTVSLLSTFDIFYLLLPICWEITRWHSQVCKFDSCLWKLVVIQDKPDPACSLQTQKGLFVMGSCRSSFRTGSQ